ncbi:hypothetical protein R1sor_015269 [Riccia sorocarpa]|uniref:Uncharacterized protein n=1 Tax=Riccia sorocarpa TaxID=122646 RepID=A0ABD3HF26_9MARC
MLGKPGWATILDRVHAEPPPLKKTLKVPAKAARKKPEAKLQQVSITVGIVGEDISQATFADMKCFMESRATVGLIALERGDATLQLHIQGVLALLSTSTKAVKQDIMEAIGWKSNCPLGGAVCVKALTKKDPDENDEEDSQAFDQLSPPNWQDLGDYVPLV